jgi:DNA-binding SARP family transcriptional activator
MDIERPDPVCLYLLGQTRLLFQTSSRPKELKIQPKPLHLLAYMALNWKQPHRREALQAQFWPDKPSRAAANNLRQALWHLRQTLPPATLHLQGDVVRWNPAIPPWVDALAFETGLEADDLDAALELYVGPLLPDAYDEWAQLERERLHLRYLMALETRAHRRYEVRRWQAALADAEALLAADTLNEAAARLVMACYWALGQREAARRCYDAFRHLVRRELQTDPLPETTALYQRILRGETHPDEIRPATDAAIASRAAPLSLLETLGAFRQGLDRATAWVAEASGPVLAAARRWQGRFCLRLGQLADARAALEAALPLSATPDLQAAVLADLATTETGLGDYSAAETHYAQALRLSPLRPITRLHLLSGLGGLQGRMGHAVEARRALEGAIRLAREQGDPAPLAIAGGNLGILLIGQGETAAAETALLEALDAAQKADAHWLTAHLTGHLGVLAQDRDDLEAAARYYERARTLAETIGAWRGAVLWALNLGVVRYEQGRCADALPLLTEGREQAAAQGSRSLEAGASIFIGACLVAQGQESAGLASIEKGLALAQSIGDQERILIGLLHRGRALAVLGREAEARDTLLEGLRQAEASRMRRLRDFLLAELDGLPSPA